MSNGAISVPVSERLEGKISTLEKSVTTLRANQKLDGHPFGNHFCVICGLPTLRTDETGLTCGDENCVRDLRERVQKKEEEKQENEELLTKVLPLRIQELCKVLGLGDKPVVVNELEDTLNEAIENGKLMMTIFDGLIAALGIRNPEGCTLEEKLESITQEIAKITNLGTQ